MNKTDPLTGLPEVPEGYFWEIKRAATPEYFRLELRKKTFWVFSDRIEYTVFLPPLSPALLNDEAEYVLEKWNAELAAAAVNKDYSRYIGKYPPKNLKDVK